MKRHYVLAGTLILVFAASLVGAQGRQGGGRGAPQAEAINWNQRMPWGPLEAAVRARWAGYPLTAQKVEPFKVFDNIYYVGIQVVSAYLVNTSAGLMLIDATYAETPDLVLDSVRKLGFDPANIRYILVTHQHFDHFAGVGRIKQAAPGARIGLSQADWEGVERQQMPGQAGNQNPGIPFARDLVIKDGDSITLGETTLKVYVTPGHTPGSLAIDVQGKAAGKTYRALIPCTGINPSADLTKPYIASMERLKQLGPWDAILPVHGFLAQVDIPLEPKDLVFPAQPAKAKPQAAHPAAMGAARINQFFDSVLKVAREKLASEQQPQRTN